MAGFGYNNRRGQGGEEMYRPKRGLGLGGEGYETGEYRPGDGDASFDAAPYDGGADLQPVSGGNMDMEMGAEDSEMSDGWSDAERAFRDEVESDPDNYLYLRANEWKRKWLQRAEQMKIKPEQAMRVLDSIADLDAQQPGDPGYGEDEAY